MVLVVQQDELFVSWGTKCRDVKRSLRIDQQDLVTSEGGSLTELGQGIIPTGTEGYLGFILEVPSEGSLQGPSLADDVVFRVLVHASFGDHKGSGTTEFIIILDADDRVFLRR